jgi:hypothetical protein
MRHITVQHVHFVQLHRTFHGQPGVPVPAGLQECASRFIAWAASKMLDHLVQSMMRVSCKASNKHTVGIQSRTWVM